MRHHDAEPTIGPGGELISGGGDLALGGVTAYYFDALYIAILVQITTIISSKFWLIFLVVSPHFPVESGLAFLACRPNTQGFRLGRELSWQVCSLPCRFQGMPSGSRGSTCCSHGFSRLHKTAACRRRKRSAPSGNEQKSGRNGDPNAMPELLRLGVQQGVDI